MRDEVFNKSFLTIKEFSELVGISEASLRRYDKIGVFKPAKRGEEFSNNYRYYSPMQLKTINVIRVLTGLGVSIKTITEIAHERTPEKLLKIFHKNKDKLTEEIKYLQEAHSIIGTFTDLLYEAISISENEITVSEMPEKKIILGSLNDYRNTDGFIREFARFCSEVHEPKLNLSYPVGGYHADMTEFINKPSQPDRFFSLDPKGNECKKAGLYLVSCTRGYYGQVNDLPGRMIDYARINGLEFSGAVYSIYLTDEVSVTNPEEYLLQVSVPVVETIRTPSHSPHHHYELLKG